MMPATCLVNTALLPFVSGFRNYAGKHLNIASTNKKTHHIDLPGGDATFSSFPKIMDNIDIVENLA